MNDYYKLLNINESASLDEIKQAFRKAALKYHPDQNQNNPAASIQFILIKNAYDILVKSENRNIYDEYQKTHKTTKHSSSINEVVLYNENIGITELFNNQLNSIFWDIEDLLHKARKNRNTIYSSKVLYTDILRLLFFIERWVLIPLGLKDYFMEARQLGLIQLASYIDNIVNHKTTFSHFPYTSVDNYFYNLRMRLNEFLSNLSKYNLFEPIANTEVTILDSIINTQNYAMHCIFQIEKALNNDKILSYDYTHSNKCFNE